MPLVLLNLTDLKYIYINVCVFPFSLQQKNKELSATVAELQEALEAEQRCKATIEILLRNAERSRDEALVRNEQLNREIQELLNRPTAGPSY